MKLVCTVSIVNRSLPQLSIKSNQKHVKSTVALCKNPKSKEFCIIVFTQQNQNGAKYEVKDNISQVRTRFVNEGKTTLQFKQPPHDLLIQAESVQLKSFLHLLKRVIDNKVSENEHTYSSMSVTPVSQKNFPVKKLVIKKRSDYPAKGFAPTLEYLCINDIRRCSLDRGILQLMKLKSLDLSQNCIENLPIELCQLPCLMELNLSHNELGKSIPKQWRWMGGNLSNSLKLLDLRNNTLKFLPDQVSKLHALISLHVDNNELQTLPSGIGRLKTLKILTISHNHLTILPGSARNWKLQKLDITVNRFGSNAHELINNRPPNVLPVCSLKECAASKVLNKHILYSPETLPLTVIDFLDCAKYCFCGNASFYVNVRQRHLLVLETVTNCYCIADDAVVPIDCYFCSMKCFRFTESYSHARRRLV